MISSPIPIPSSTPLAAEVPRVPPEAAWGDLLPHPRLLASADRLKEVQTQDDEISRQLRLLLHRQAERHVTAPPIEFPAQGILLLAVRESQGRILALALEYRLSRERIYLDRAREELLHLTDLTEWRPAHFLSVGEAALAAGIALDWLYDDLSPEDRDRVTRAIVQNALLPSLEVPVGGGNWVDADFNWAQVCHAGLVVGALAIAEREPGLARQVVERAVNNMGNAGGTYAPDGSYAEGPSYWTYGTTFHVILTEALRSGLGSSCALEKFPGFLQTASYKIQMTAPSGQEFNYADYHEENQNQPVLLWFARENRDLALAREELTDLARLSGVEPGEQRAISRFLPLGLLWWDPAVPADLATRPCHWTAAGVLPLAVLREQWGDTRASYLAIKGGSPYHSHAHMDVGSFILEADGVRWALDLGTESYNLMRAANLDLWNYSQDSSRWTVFRVGPEGHNIIRFEGEHQRVHAKAEIHALPDEGGAVGNVVDLTPIYAGQVTHATRTVKLHLDRSMTIEDQWTAGDRAVSASWQWLTLAEVTHAPEGLILSQANQTLTLKVESGPRSIAVEDVSVPRFPQDSPNPGLKRIIITLPTPAHSTARIGVRAFPGSTIPSTLRP